MDFGKAFTFTFDDPDWIKKVLIGGVVTLVPIVNFAATGYSLEVTKRVINGEPRLLPEWDDFGGKFVKGLLVFVIGFVYALPILLLVCLMQGGMMLLGGAAGSSRSGSDAAGGAIGILSACFGCLIFLYSLFLGLVLPAAIGNYAARGELGAAFRFADIASLVQKNIGAYLMVLLIEIAGGLVASLIGSIACGIGLIFTAFWAMLVNGHATGQAYREASSAIGLV
jgi:hypothetical protein